MTDCMSQSHPLNQTTSKTLPTYLPSTQMFFCSSSPSFPQKHMCLAVRVRVCARPWERRECLHFTELQMLL